MLPTCFMSRSQKTKKSVPITVIDTKHFPKWIGKQSKHVKNWLKQTGFNGKQHQIQFLYDKNGEIERVLVGAKDINDMSIYGELPKKLPHQPYCIETLQPINIDDLERALLAWGLGAYQFQKYKIADIKPAQLVMPKSCEQSDIQHIISAIYSVRDLVNTPTEDLGPEELALFAKQLAKTYKAKFKQIVGNDLLKQNFRGIHTVGRASMREPRLIELRWGEKAHPQITLVGKGVCFDSGGLQIKSHSGMQLMKKDMGGAAHALGLAQMIMAAKLPLQIKVLIPAVENAVSGNAYRPGDIIRMKNNTTVEVLYTDAEGRLILADALTEAQEEKTDLIIDFATLTGAARVALGPDIGALFTDNDEIANAILKHANAENDPIWRLPLYTPYEEMLESPFADIANIASKTTYGGAIMAALFLKKFIQKNTSWIHFDIPDWNDFDTTCHPQGGEAHTLIALWYFLNERFC